ncbi:MAG: thioredoxin domain-containing protein [Acidimicrobiales bacterium]|nr:thioredoxin domain-containing protein [Acidimicrobiales bacterium]
MNLLGSQTSPYLRQHANNPVHWYPWGDEARAAATKRDVPILLSIGYSACHWCHVMAHECFENAAIAEQMNAGFVNVKVDREERPDVDSIYMDAVTALTGRGGWPMTVFCHPDGRPFHGGTYWPDRPRGGMPSFPQVLEAVVDAWTNRRDDLSDLGDRLTASMARHADLPPSATLPPPEALATGVSHLATQHDDRWGGFGDAPKFPQAMSLEALLRHLAAGRTTEIPDMRATEVATTTLDAMASGGIYDHLGGGFARYSVDSQWLVPHFEKMLYDNAMLARVYLHGWQVLGHQRWLQVATETIDYVLTDLRHPAGGFFSAEDADSEGAEGTFYLWSEAEIRALCDKDAEAALEWYGVSADGNFEGSNILHRPVRGGLQRPEAIQRARQALAAQREKRIRPGLDDKVLTEWNGLMLATLAEAAMAVGREDWLEVARTNADFLCRTLRREDGRWLRAWQADGGAHTLGYAADHAAMIDGLTRLGEASGESRWTALAVSTADVMLDLFLDEAHGGFFSTGNDAETLVRRPKDLLDNAHPSANSLAALALLRLGSLVGDARYTEAAESVLQLLGEQVANHPTAFGHLLGATDLFHSGITAVVVTGNRPDLVAVAAGTWRPNTVLAWGEPFGGPLWAGRSGDQAWVCRDFTCRSPISDTEALTRELS